MRKKESEDQMLDDEMRPEYDFSGGERGAAYRPLDRGYVIREEHADGSFTETYVAPKGESIFLDPDVRQYFPDSESVNRALRTIISLFPAQKVRDVSKQDSQPKARRVAGARGGRS